MADKRVVDAVRVTVDHATCPCGEVIALADPDDSPLPSVAGKQFIYRSWLVSSAPSAAPKCGWIGEISRCGRIELAQ
jgi:hypothetical protein